MHKEIFKKLSEEVKSQLELSMATKEVQEVIVETKAKSDSGNFKFIASTPAIDRQGESIDQNGWELENYLKNSVLLWAHDYTQPPIGIVDKIGMENGNLVIEGRFAPTDFGQQIRKLYDLQMINTVSVGFIPKEMNGNIITKSELLEVSVVPVPANPQALSLRQIQEAGVELEMLKVKGLDFGIEIKDTEQKAPIEGETCKMPDGADGTMEMNTEGEMVCVPVVMEESKSQLEVKIKDLETEITSLKAGRVLSEKNRTLIKSTIDGLTATKDALQELFDATDQGDKKGDPASEKEADETKTKNQFSEADIKAMESWLLIKQLTGTAVTALSAAGAVVNKKIDAQK